MKDILFNFNDAHLSAALLSFIPALINIGLVIYCLFRLPRNKATTMFSLFILACINLQLNDTLLRLSADAKTADAWSKIFYQGWMAMGVFCLHFAVLYATKVTRKTLRLILPAIYVPYFFLSAVFVSNPEPVGYINHEFWGWLSLNRINSLDDIQRLWLALLVFISVVLISRKAMQSQKDPLVKNQARLIAIGMLITCTQGTITQMIFPDFLHLEEIPLTSFTMTIFSLLTIVALTKYKLFDVAEAVKTGKVLEKITDFVFIVSGNKKVVYVNPFAIHQLNLKDDDLHSFSFDNYFLYRSEQLDEFQKTVIDDSLSGKVVRNLDFEFSIGNGKKINLIFSTELIISNDIIQGILIVGRDITERKIAAEKINAQNLELIKTNKELDQFVYSVSHDLRAPLSSILGIVELSKDDTKEPETLEYLNMIEGSVKKLDGFIHDILDYSRNARTEVEKKEVNIKELIDDSIKQLKYMSSSNRQVEIKVNFLLCNPVYSDKTRVGIVLNNLISNAIRYQNYERNDPMVEITAKSMSDETIIIIHDNGIGIPAESRNKIFDMFYRVSSNSEGSGIGLYIVKEAIDKLNGKIDIESQMGVGTTFTVTIPNNPSIPETPPETNYILN